MKWDSGRSVLRLPPEMLLSIAEFLDIKALHFLRCSSRQLASLLDSKFYRIAAKSVIEHRGHRKSPLFWASGQGKLPTVQKLLAAGADTATMIDGFSALHCATRNGHADIAWLLIQAGADPIQATGTGYTPLVLAAEHGHLETVRLLLGILDMDNVASQRSMKRALGQASYFGHLQVTRFMLEQAEENPRLGRLGSLGWDDGEEFLYQAARVGHCDMIRLLLAYGAVLPPVHRRSRHPLLIATQNGHREAMGLLMHAGTDRLAAARPVLSSTTNQGIDKYGKDPSQPTKDGRTPLQIALEDFSPPEIIHQLLDRGADVQVRGRGGTTALHTLVQLKRNDLLETFLSSGALLSAKDDRGNTPLLLAVKLSNGVAAALFIEYGADVSARDNHGRTALHIAASQGSSKVLSMLLDSKADLAVADHDGRIPLHYAAVVGNLLLFQAILSRHEKADTDYLVRSSTGRTVLELAAESGHVRLLQLLVDRGINVNEAWKGYSALHAAVANKHYDVVKLLLAAGASPLCLDYYGRTPFDLASVDSSMLDILNESCDIPYKRTDPETRIATLRNNVLSFATQASDGRTTDLYKLAKCLVYVRDGDAALTVFRRAARVKACDDDLRYPMSCSGCQKRLTGKGRSDILVLVCRRCHELDLCEFSGVSPFLGFYSTDAGFAVDPGSVTGTSTTEELWSDQLAQLIAAYS
ncbi:ankyrin repeat-containing domain protein [Aspergillus unguis]